MPLQIFPLHIPIHSKFKSYNFHIILSITSHFQKFLHIHPYIYILPIISSFLFFIFLLSFRWKETFKKSEKSNPTLLKFLFFSITEPLSSPIRRIQNSFVEIKKFLFQIQISNFQRGFRPTDGWTRTIQLANDEDQFKFLFNKEEKGGERKEKDK